MSEAFDAAVSGILSETCRCHEDSRTDAAVRGIDFAPKAYTVYKICPFVSFWRDETGMLLYDLHKKMIQMLAIWYIAEPLPV